jgi:hypothetical protein
MPRLFLRAAAASLAFATPAFASETVTRAQVLEAIRTFDANALGSLAAPKPEAEAGAEVARDSNTILAYALESDDVLVDLGPDSVPWCDVKKGLSDLSNSGERGLLLAAYISGCVKAQLQSGKQDANPLAGWVAMLRVYRAVKVREGVKIPEIEALLAMQMNGSIDAYAVAALKRSSDSLRRTYGPSAGPPRQESPALAAQP